MEKKQSLLKNKKILVYFLGGMIIFLMVGSLLSLWAFKGENGNTEVNAYEYNGYKFLKANNGFILSINNKDIGFNYLPNELEGINNDDFNFLNNKYYVIFNPEELNEGSYEINRIRGILNYFNILGAPACDKEEKCSDIPVKDCSVDAVYIKKGENKIYKDNKCIVLSYNEDSAKIVDLFFYKALGVMK